MLALIVKENDQRVEDLLKKREGGKAAELCFCLETSRAMKINVIKTFIDAGKVQIKGDELSLLSDKALKSLLCVCLLATTGKVQRITVFAKTPQRKVWQYI